MASSNSGRDEKAAGMEESQAQAKKRRQLQNRLSQRAHRQRKKAQAAKTDLPMRPFQVDRWRLDEIAYLASQGAPAAPQGTTVADDWTQPESDSVTLQPPQPHQHYEKPLTCPVDGPPVTPPAIVFPLSTDHLIHLIQYNVFRAFVSNKRTLNTFLTGWKDPPPSPVTCPLSGPYVDNTMIYPLNPNTPPALVPTRLQQLQPHHLWLNLLPFPQMRDNLIMHEGLFDHWDMLGDLIGELLVIPPLLERKGGSQSSRATGHTPGRSASSASVEGSDEVTSGRTRLVVWGEPHESMNWEATPAFLTKWAWAVKGCGELLASSNRWRLERGEEPIRFVDVSDEYIVEESWNLG
ncbi:uncharacterized protein RHO25_004808 [Cercospora beticola]|uniref:BZIP domain-containing protein n=1 Tax=Cercospora beticola TaxID=122368 RepID=A0ABZ0NKU9_CERBT|nr:hypothetical protein RHO25_004808 [Cercospora beticola]CAK1361620.1 unnamed protein product [Cercospora beticola]